MCQRDHRPVQQVNLTLPSLWQKTSFASLQLLATSTVILVGKRIIRWRSDKGGEFTFDEFKRAV